MHKGFKCLDPKEGRIYISRDVVFYEEVFPFSSLHPNTGARLRAELALLLDILKNPSSDFENVKIVINIYFLLPPLTGHRAAYRLLMF